MKAPDSSMEPSLYTDDIVVVDTGFLKPTNGAVYLIRIDNIFSLRRLRRRSGEWWITSDNSSHQVTDMPLEEGNKIIGKVVRKHSGFI